MKLSFPHLLLALCMTTACAKQKGGGSVQDPLEKPQVGVPVVVSPDEGGPSLSEGGCLPQRSWEEALNEEESVKLLAQVFVEPNSPESQAAVKKAQEGQLNCP